MPLGQLDDPVPPAEATADSPTVGPHHRTVQWVHQETTPEGQNLAITNSYVELGLGLNRWDADRGDWVPAQAEFEQTADGYFIARQTQHQVILSPDLAVEGAVDFLTPDGQRLRSTPLGIALLDTQSGMSVMLGEITSCQAEWLAPGEVIYRGAFEGLNAHVRYRLSLSGFEQDILLEDEIGPELVAELGLDPGSTRALVLTEVFEGPEPERVDVGPGIERLSFGAMHIDPGQAFRIESDRAEASAPVRPSWELIEGRRFLVEWVDYVALGPLMDALPKPDQGRIDTLKSRVRRTASVTPRRLAPRHAHLEGNGGSPVAKPGEEEWWLRSSERGRAERGGDSHALRSAATRSDDGAWPGRRPARPHGWGTGVELASLRPWASRLAATQRPSRGLVLDYALQLSTGQSNHVFKGDTTYYVSVTAALPLKGLTTFEGGTVIKFTNGAKLKIEGPIAWQGTAYRPVVLTARDDASVGDAVQYANNLSGYYAGVALEIDRTTNATAAILQHFRIAHAQTAIAISGQAGHVFSHGQLVNCQRGFSPTNAESSLRNLLFHNVLTNFSGSGSTGRCEHLTVHTATWLNYNNACAWLYLTNCLLAGVTNAGTVTVSVGGVSLGSASGVFQTVGQGANYLAADSPYRNYSGASTSINSELAATLKSLTTYPPLVLSNHFTSSVTLSPQAQRDAAARDLGYHYAPLDYCWSGLNLTNATLLLTNGVAVGMYGSSGTTLRRGAKFISEGRPSMLNRLVQYQAVQEQPVVWGTSGSGAGVLSLNASSPPEVRLRFTDVSVLAHVAAKRHLIAGLGGSILSTLALSDSQIRGVNISVWAYAPGMAISWRNNLMQRCLLYCYQVDIPGYYGFTLDAYNNLFLNGSLTFSKGDTRTAWTLKDNAFDNATASASGYLTLGNNGYINTTSLGGSSNVVVSSFTYANATLGNWYHASTNFIDRGSRLAGAAGLYHHTTTTNQVKDASTAVDIGFHYVATDANGLPLDYDGDGWADYFEDRNGNGTVDSGETDWTTYTSQYGVTGVPGVSVFTPLR